MSGASGGRRTRLRAGSTPPLVGGFEDGRGTFFSRDVVQGVAVDVRFVWVDLGGDAARWEQAFSTDEGETWDTNWVMEMTRTA
jgi:hypothetical protein